MTNLDILHQIQPFIACEKEITLQTPCKEFLDSLGFIQLILECESLFDIVTDDEDLFLDRYIIVNDFIDMIKSHIHEGCE